MIVNLSISIMERVKPGHNVIFEGLEGASSLDRTKGTIVKFSINKSNTGVFAAISITAW